MPPSDGARAHRDLSSGAKESKPDVAYIVEPLCTEPSIGPTMSI